jgi:hypothetical protein
MKKVITLLLMAAGVQQGIAQTDTTGKKDSDTIRVGSIIIVNKSGGNSTIDVTNKESHKHYENHWNWDGSHKHHLDNISTNWLIIDVGFSGFNDKTNYASAEAQAFLHDPQGTPLNSGDFSTKSVISNFDLWLFMQKLNIYKHVVNLKYGFGIQNNDYYYKTPITYVDGANPYVIRSDKHFSRNKLAADFFTIPVMLNITTNPGSRYGGLQLSFGVSAGYLYASRQKQISAESGKQVVKTDFNLERWRINYVAELGVGPVKVYGSYGLTSVHKYGVDQIPYTVGLRLSSW